jgi:hypothetical protein
MADGFEGFSIVAISDEPKITPQTKYKLFDSFEPRDVGIKFVPGAPMYFRFNNRIPYFVTTHSKPYSYEIRIPPFDGKLMMSNFVPFLLTKDGLYHSKIAPHFVKVEGMEQATNILWNYED